MPTNLTPAIVQQLNNLPGFPPASTFTFGDYLNEIPKPRVLAAAALPLTGNDVGDVRFALAEGAFYYWDGAMWNVVGGGAPAPVDLADDYTFQEGFTGLDGTDAQTNRWFQDNGGTSGTNTTISGEQNHPGILRTSTGADTAGKMSLFQGFFPFEIMILGGALRYTWEAIMRPSGAPTVAQDYTAFMGLNNAQGSGAVTQSASFMIDRTLSATNWICETVQDNVPTRTVTGVAIANAFSRFKIDVNADATEVLFYIDSTLVATHTTNIPAGGTRFVSICHRILKSAGTTPAYLDADFIGCRFRRS